MGSQWGTLTEHIPTVLYALTTGACPAQADLIYWPLSSPEQLVVKCLVQGHLDGTLQKSLPF